MDVIHYIAIGVVTVLVVIVFWDRRDIQRLVDQNISMAKSVADTFLEDAAARKEETLRISRIMYQIMADAKEERQVALDRLVYLSAGGRDGPPVPLPPAGEPGPISVTDEAEYNWEIISKIEADMNVGQEEATVLYKQAFMANPSPAALRVRSMILDAASFEGEGESLNNAGDARDEGAE